ASRLIRIGAASLGLGLTLALASYFRGPIEGLFGRLHLGPLGPKEFAITLVVTLGAALYPMLLFAFGGLTLAEARAALRRRKGEPAAPAADLPPPA
ncbi:MAG TPA: hypothetical protein VFH92_14375, partial [Phenylobacterium sp.]|nr:hypothetical protein [Phenylobacterium sp.]